MSAPTAPARGRPAWDSTPERQVLPGVALLVAVAALVPAVAATLLRVVGPTDDTWALVSAFVPYGQLGYPIALLALLVAWARARRRRAIGVLALLVAALTALHVAWAAPLFVPDHRPVVGPSFTLLAQNAYLGGLDTEALTTLVLADDVDVVVLSESTAELLERLGTTAWQERYPYAVGDLSGPLSDTTVFSRFPLDDVAALQGTASSTWVVTLRVPGRSPVRLVAAHPCNPYCGNGAFARDHALVEQAVRANLDQPLVLAGDLNATDDHGPLQRMRADGMRSATDLVGAGWVPTWPANRSFPPLLPIDHVLVDDQLTATAQRTVRLPDTDHLGLLVTLAGTR